MEFKCKHCGKAKRGAPGWLLGYELYQPGTGTKNTIILLEEWNERGALEANAVHFCSQRCHDRYVSSCYGQEFVAA